MYKPVVLNMAELWICGRSFPFAVLFNLAESVTVTLRLMVGQSVSMSWCGAPSGAHYQIFVNCLTATVLSYLGAISDEKSGLYFVSQSKVFVSMYIYIYLTFCMFDMCYKYNIYKPFISPGFVQQIIPYWLWLKPPRQSRHLNGHTCDRHQV
jgi:hypothetical protein